jgi:tRNA threonylcarbamoyladenosine biosynthesis protein TsaE
MNEAVYWHEEVTVATAAQMRALGRRLASLLRAGDLVILSGSLGAGKTTLTQGIGEGLGVRGPVTSPTFVIARVHPPLKPAAGLTAAGPALVHADAYRLGSVLEMDDLDLDADTADRLEITIAPAADGVSLEGDSPRAVTITGIGERWRGIQLPPADLADRL